MHRYVSLLSVVGLNLVATGALAATIDSNGRVAGNWSNPALWVGGVVPGADDTARLWNLSTLTYDVGASGNVDAISANALTFTLRRNLETQNAYLREVVLSDGGFNFTVHGTLSNYLMDGYEGNGGRRNGQGGNLSIGNLVLGRTAQFTFYPGDTVNGSYTTHRIRSSWPDISVTQDPTSYGDRLGEGLSFDAPNSNISLGRTSGTDQAEITLNWDSELTGDIDWTLRWAGNHVAALQSYYNNGQLKIGTLPTAVDGFDSNRDIFYDASTNHTYVGFRTLTFLPTLTEDTFGAARPNKAIDTSLWTPFGMVTEESGYMKLQGTASHPYVQSVREFTADATVPLVLDITFSATSTTHGYVYTQSSAGQYNGAISDGIGFWLGNNSWSLVKVQDGVLTHLHWGQSLVAIQPEYRYEVKLVDTGATLTADIVVKDGAGAVLMTRSGSASYTFTPALPARYVGVMGRNGATMWVDSIRISSL
jgi:hypothetical protein